jgi:hypothetical protein
MKKPHSERRKAFIHARKFNGRSAHAEIHGDVCWPLQKQASVGVSP